MSNAENTEANAPRTTQPSANDILLAARTLVTGPRDRQHGAKKDNFDRIAALWNAWLGIRKDPSQPLSAHDVGQMMSLLKKARTQSGDFNVDDYVDDAGYTGCAGECCAASSQDRQEVKKPKETDGWQPIETAPRDGSPVLVCCEFWDSPSVNEGRYMTRGLGGAHWRTAEGYVSESIITRWMPLPEAPKC